MSALNSPDRDGATRFYGELFGWGRESTFATQKSTLQCGGGRRRSVKASAMTATMSRGTGCDGSPPT